VPSAGDVIAALSAWPCRIESVTPLAGGWNSAAWLAVTAEGWYVAKLVDDLDAAGLASGLRVAEFLAARGLACGAPARTRDGFPVASDPRYRWPWDWVAPALDTIAMPEQVNAAARRI
jgi:hypothetical protein